MKKIGIFLGTRPEGIKMAPVEAALRQQGKYEVVVLNTGQHLEMLQQVIDLFKIQVDVKLEVMTRDQTLADLTARLMMKLDKFLAGAELDLALVQGDTTTVMSSALSCFYQNVPIGHVEAGLRTDTIRSPWPEEANRRLTSQLADLHFAPTETARKNLLGCGVADARIAVTGNTVIDALFMEVQRQRDPAVNSELETACAQLVCEDWQAKPFILITGHRRENFGDGFIEICSAIKTLAERYPTHNFIYPLHLNPNVQTPVSNMLADIANIQLIEPLDYSLFVKLMSESHIILTDSGGVQEEAPSLGKPVLVMRDETERPEGVEAGTVKLTGPHADRIIEEISTLIDDESAYKAMSEARNPYGDGHAAGRIVERIDQFFS